MALCFSRMKHVPSNQNKNKILEQTPTVTLGALRINYYYVHQHNFIFKRVIIGYALESLIPVTALQLSDRFIQMFSAGSLSCRNSYFNLLRHNKAINGGVFYSPKMGTQLASGLPDMHTQCLRATPHGRMQISFLFTQFKHSKQRELVSVDVQILYAMVVSEILLSNKPKCMALI